ncbi:MAG: DUF6502 family protein [Deltaproteobacteria bacterium]|nr:DUF6502 family protein [Deltaproteobacteria bacterium]
MKPQIARAVSSAVARILRPLVRVLLRNGIPYGAFADIAKRIYVDVATEEFGIPGRKQSKSRVAILTGLSRKEVLRVTRLPAHDDSEAIARYNRAARVIGGWLRDGRFQAADGNPADLPFEGEGGTLAALVRTYSGDATPRAVLDELLRVGAVERTVEGNVRLVGRAYVPRTGETEKIAILGTDVADLVATIDHNIRNPERPVIQRKVSYDNLPAEAMPELRKLAGERGQALLEDLDRWLSARDRDATPAAGGTGRKRAGIGIYYFEEDYGEEGKS